MHLQMKNYLNTLTFNNLDRGVSAASAFLPSHVHSQGAGCGLSSPPLYFKQQTFDKVITAETIAESIRIKQNSLLISLVENLRLCGHLGYIEVYCRKCLEEHPDESLVGIQKNVLLNLIAPYSELKSSFKKSERLDKSSFS